MAELDQRLRGKGVPNRISRRSVDREVENMNRFIDEYIDVELTMTKRRRRIDKFYHEHPFLVWLIATVVGVIAIFVA